MRENRTYGSEGGEANASPTPIRLNGHDGDEPRTSRMASMARAAVT